MELAETLATVGRVVIGVFFTIAAFRNTIHFRERVPSATVYGRNMPVPLVALGFAMQWIGGLSLIFGLWTVWGALVLIAFLVLATAFYHNPLVFAGKERDPHLYLTLVNATLVGALLLVIADAL